MATLPLSVRECTSRTGLLLWGLPFKTMVLIIGGKLELVGQPWRKILRAKNSCCNCSRSNALNRSVNKDGYIRVHLFLSNQLILEPWLKTCKFPPPNFHLSGLISGFCIFCTEKILIIFNYLSRRRQVGEGGGYGVQKH